MPSSSRGAAARAIPPTPPPRRRGRRQRQGRSSARPANAATKLTIASKNFTEEFILGEIYSQALAAGGYKVRKRLNLGSEKVAFRAVKGGKIDAYPEYTGTALTTFFGVKTDDIPKDEQQAYDQAKALRQGP